MPSTLKCTKSLHFLSAECNGNPKDSDECLQVSPKWGPKHSCSSALKYNGGILCNIDSWAKDMRRCCPISCGTGVLTENDCNALDKSSGTCVYPNEAQC